MPPAATDYSQWAVPESLKDDVRLANKAIFGRKAESIEPTKFRICWSAALSLPPANVMVMLT